MTAVRADVTDLAVARGAAGLLQEFNTAGVLGLADVHTARTVSRITGSSDEQVQLALALTVRALRMGSVCVDLQTVATSAFDEYEEAIDVSNLPWPAVEDWLTRCRKSALVTVGAEPPGARPLRLVSGLLYLERYWQQQEVVRRQLQHWASAEPPKPDLDRLRAGLDRLFDGAGLGPSETDQQRLATAVSALSWVTVLAGGPGTGKTTTVARLLALLRELAGPGARIALAAPTGKAAARLQEAVQLAAKHLTAPDRQRLDGLAASTLHRLLGWVPGSRSRFRHHAGNHLPYDVIVVDEMSMVSLTMMARLLEAVRPSARLILVGDPDQLSSVEAGAVLADITQATGLTSPTLAGRLRELDLNGASGSGDSSLATRHGVVHLEHTWRYSGAIDRLARAVRASDPDQALAVLRSGAKDVVFAEVDVEHGQGLAALEEQVRTSGRALAGAAVDGDVSGALAALDRHRLLCAHRRGPYGVVRWGREVERWLAAAVPGYGEDGEWYVGRPLLVTANDYEMNLYNGDTGVVVNTPQGVRAAFARGGEPILVAPVRLDAVQTLHAMTVHRAQGSQFSCVSIILPPPESPLLTRELLYTAATRAADRVQIFGSAEAVRRAVIRPANRASGLRGRVD
ncbi:MAG TPA: exodeoxyribonuclease V subunit alpha [Propionibacteriaceae bacterium]|nr:exodeoxyribonuclease V subunit alpha [Propionibacteriaceae bacterium]